MKALLALVVCGACANLPATPQGTCGNGVIDPGEDCDLPDSSVCSQCAYTCGHCPDGYACSERDQLCHAPTGEFTKDPATKLSFPAITGYIADLDGDHIPDLIGLSGTSLVTTYGEPHGHMSVQSTQVTPVLSGPGAFAVRPLAGGGDQLLLGTADGIAGYQPVAGKLLPYPFSNSLVDKFGQCAFFHQPGLVTLASFAYDSDHVNVVVRDGSGMVWLGVLEILTGECGFASACGMKTDPGQLVFADMFDTSAGGVPSELVALGISEPLLSQAPTACVMRETVSAPLPPPPQMVPGAPTDNHGAPMAFARLDASACPWLVTAAGPVTAIAPAVDALGCTLSATTVTLRELDPGAGVVAGGAPIGRIPLVPAVPGLAPDALVVSSWPPDISGRAAIVGVHAPMAGVAQVESLYTSPTALVLATSGTEPSGRVRVAVASAFDVEALERIGTTKYFDAFRIATSGSPSRIQLVDLDADGLLDLAYVEQTGNGQRLNVAWGTSGLPEAPQEVADGLPTVLGLVPIGIPDSTDPQDLIPDLAIVDYDDQPRLVVFHGGPQRTLPAYFDPRKPPIAASAFATLLAGAYLTPDRATDVLAIQVPLQGATSSLWELPGANDGSIEGVGDPTSLDTASCATASSVTLCADSASYSRWPIAMAGGGHRDVAIGVDTRGAIATLDPDNTTQPLEPCAPGACSLPAAATSPWQLRGLVPGDVGRGPQLFAMYAFAPDYRQAVGLIESCQVSAQGVATSCEQLTFDPTTGPTGTPGAVQDLGRVVCTDAVVGRASPPTAALPDVMLLCRADDTHAQLWRLGWSGTAYTASPVRPLGNAHFLVFDDVTGDGLPDLIVITVDQATPYVEVYPQCEHRDLACLAEALP